MNKYLSIINLNVNGLNAPIKRHRIAEWIRNHDPHMCCLQETHLRTKDLHSLKVKGSKQIFKVMRTRGLQPRLLYPARLSIKIEGQIRSFPDRRRLKEYTSTKLAVQEMLKGLLRKGRKRERNRRT